MGLGEAKRIREVLKSSCGGTSHKGVPMFMGGVDPSRHHGAFTKVSRVVYQYILQFVSLEHPLSSSMPKISEMSH